MVNDEQFSRLAEQSYWVEESRNDVPYIPEEGMVYYYSGDKPSLGQFQVIAVQDTNSDGNLNNNNGMQAMAVAPYVNGKVDTSQVVIAYAGTNFSDIRDVDTDNQLVIRGDDKGELVSGNIDGGNFIIAENQLKSAQLFYEQIKENYPHSALTTTGHSLGAYIALIIAAENQIPSTTFNGPDPIRGMSDDAITWVKEHNGLYNNYRINFDLIGNFGAYLGADELNISRNVNVDKFSINPLYYHNLAAYQFNKDGQIVDKKGNIIGSQYLLSQAYLNLFLCKQTCQNMIL